MQIKLFDPKTDYPYLAAIESAIFTDEVLTAQTFIDQNQRNPAHIKQQRFVAWLEGQAVGFGQYSQNAGQYHPQRFSIWIAVHPEFEQRGIGTALYNTVFDDVAQHKPVAFTSSTREDKNGLAFLQTRGFVEKMRTWENRIDLRQYDPTSYLGLHSQLGIQGIEFISLEQFLQLPDAKNRYFQLNQTLSRDVPRFYPYTERSFEEWASWNLSAKTLQAGTFFAMRDGEPLGFSQLFESDGDYLTIGLTGVLREYRGQQLALALKTACLEWAKAGGYPEIRTWNDSNNAPILALNQKLGFVRCPAWIEYIKELE